MSRKHLTDQKFSELNLIETLKLGVADAGFEYCTPIQEKSLPIALAGGDVAGQAQTGTGKTIAFLLACCQYLLSNPLETGEKSSQVRGFILAPTRELAIQIHKEAQVLFKHTGLKLGLVYGGTGYEEQKQMLAEGVDILIGTPGRLIDFYKQKLFSLSSVQTVVLDEADRMFDLGFIKDIRYLLRKMPKPEQRLNMLYSATLSFRVMELAYEHMNNPEEIKIDSDIRVADKINEYCYYPAVEEKPSMLVNLLKSEGTDKTLIFVNTRHAVETVAGILSANDISNAAISGNVPQQKRERLLEGFKTGKYGALVATDVAARGLHIPEVSHVINYDMPQDAEDYVHRVGRTARAGNSGNAVNFLCEKYAYSIFDIETYIGHSIPKKSIEPWMLEPIAKSNSSANAKKKERPPAKKSLPRKPKIAKSVDSDDLVGAEILAQADDLKVQADDLNMDITPTPPLEVTVIRESKTGTNAEESQSAESTSDTSSSKPHSEPDVQVAYNLALKPRFSRKFGEIPQVG